MSRLFTPIRLRELDIKNRIFMSPMCQYSATDGNAGNWHLAHYGGRAAGGAGLLIFEATAVCPEGRITPYDLGLWSDSQIAHLSPITRLVQEQGAAAVVQLAHAGRKASTDSPGNGGKVLPPNQGGWVPQAPSAIPFQPAGELPQALTTEQIENIPQLFAAAAKRAQAAGFDAVEIHMAHGYLLHEFLSPISNLRSDEYGGSFENRIRLPLATARAVRAAWPQHLPVLTRISASDWIEGGWDLQQSIQFCEQLKHQGIDFIDVSSGGLTPTAGPATAPGPGFQSEFSAAIRQQIGIKTGTVGFYTDALQAEQALADGQADAILLGRELLRNPSWPLTAAKTLGDDISWPHQYQRAKI